MVRTEPSILDLPHDARPDPDELVRAAMAWHFAPETGSPFWLRRAATLDFDPLADVKGYDDLTLFPNVANELRDVPAADLVPRGYGPRPDLVGVFESGGTTGAPKRVVCPADWLEKLVAWSNANLDVHGFPRGADWLGITPSGPHIVGEIFRRSALTHGRHGFTVDLDPRWVKRLIADGRGAQADAYAEHVVDQAAHILRTQPVGVLTVTPPLLERIARRDDLVELVNEKVRAIRWGGTQMDADTAELYRTEIFPGTTLYGHYGSTMILGIAGQRYGTPAGEPCVFDTFSPYITFQVVDPRTRRPVAYGERGQVVMHHVSKALLLPNNLERDTAVRVPAPEGAAGDSAAGIAPVERFDDEVVIEGVY
ncbi:AMP-binding protein [Streptomyces caatingaensis]|uniref:Phenazine antibiotic biosynthesis protein n=1 Tax=Streptomyces caatingaensis TaxID=1678637 RepID=A0A0K9XFJ3_9ACTN|nr:AMP-binding protein [Streptomyces caatingaensis]KNB52174.1 phenazine antibiotic biosynthesis protein [Streptomyces caatingaensis]